MSPPTKPAVEALDQASAALWHSGVRVLQGYRLAPTEAGHCGKLLEFMAPPPGAIILDIGCGFGEAARLMALRRPDLGWILLNDNRSQLARAPAFCKVLADMHAIPLRDASVDGAMMLYSLCHADLMPALAEAARVVKPGGHLTVYDYERTGADDGLFELHLHARAYDLATLKQACTATGWQLKRAEHPAGDDAVFRGVMDPALYAAIFAALRPVLWQAVRHE